MNSLPPAAPRSFNAHHDVNELFRPRTRRIVQWDCSFTSWQTELI
jgi:hypothetical protein